MSRPTASRTRPLSGPISGPATGPDAPLPDDGPELADFMPGAPLDGVLRAGAPAPAGVPRPDREALVAALKTVYDPEIPVDIYELGLIYNLEQPPAGGVRVSMTLTAPACPVAGILPQQVADRLAAVPGAGPVTVTLVWDPPWSRNRMSDTARLALDMF